VKWQGGIAYSIPVSSFLNYAGTTPVKSPASRGNAAIANVILRFCAYITVPAHQNCLNICLRAWDLAVHPRVTIYPQVT